MRLAFGPRRYEFLYKQAVGTSDNFLGISYVHKDASSASCEDLVVRIDLPGARKRASVCPGQAPCATLPTQRRSNL